MAVYVDATKEYRPSAIHPAARRHGRLWCHMFADTLEELHAMAKQLGLKREWFQEHNFPHYDLLPRRRAAAVRAGVEEISLLDFMRERAAKRA